MSDTSVVEKKKHKKAKKRDGINITVNPVISNTVSISERKDSSSSSKTRTNPDISVVGDLMLGLFKALG